MKNTLILLALCGLLSACGTVTESGSGPVKTLTYQCDCPDSSSGSARPTPYVINMLIEKSMLTCPAGYEKIKEYQQITPPRSKYIWDIKCL